MKYALILLISLMGISLEAQNYVTKETASKKALKSYRKALELSRANQNKKAISEFNKAIKEEPTFIDAMIELGAVHFVNKDDSATEKTLEQVVALDPYYRAKLLYTLAVIEKRNGKCDEATEHAKMYLNAPKKREVIEDKTKRLIESCAFEMSIGNEVVKFDPKPLDGNINTSSREYLPGLSADGEILFFTRVTRGQEDIYFAERQGDGWSTAYPLPNVNTLENEGNQSVSADGKYLVFTACNRKDGYGSCDIYFSSFQNGKWSRAENIGGNINTSGWESQPSISADGRTIYFTTRRKGTIGKSDIFMSQRNEDDQWSKAIPIQGEVNTELADQTPFIHPDGKTLYFKSEGHPGFGGFDLYYSRLGDDGKWGKPVNLGKPINSPKNEGSLIVSLDGKTAYFDSDKIVDKDNKGSEQNPNLHDIYQMELDEKIRPLPVTYVKAKVIDAKTKRPISAKIEFVDLGTQNIHAYSLTDNTGTFLVCLPLGEDYALNVSKKNYLFHSENFALKETKDGKPYEMIIELQEIPKEIIAETPVSKPTYVKPKPIILKNIFFATGSADLQPTSEGELQKLLALLNENPNMKIQINGHTDNVGSDADNLKLSEDRAKAVKDYLIQKGISSSRLKSKGFGETQPIDTNDTQEGKQNNRRTEFVIVN